MASFSDSSEQREEKLYRFQGESEETGKKGGGISAEIGGRSLVASRDLRKGEIVILEEAFAISVGRRFAEVACSYCGNICGSEGTVMRASEEDTLRYCSEKCITDDYVLHQHEISALVKLKAWEDVVGFEVLRLIVRIAIIKRRDGGAADNSGSSFPLLGRLNSFKTFMKLEAASALICDETLQSIRNSASGIAKDLKSIGVNLGSADIFRIILIIQCNAHTVKDDVFGHIGVGLFPTTSMMNHSCTPNCSHHFVIRNGRPPEIHMIATEDIACGTELCYSYVPLYLSTDSRSKLLKSAYSFVCSCRRCSDCSLYTQTSNDTHVTLYPDDRVITQDCGTSIVSRVAKEFEICISMASSSLSRLKGLQKLLIMMNDSNKAGLFNIAHGSLLQSYVGIAKSSFNLISEGLSAGDDDVDLNAISYSFGILAIACISYLTKVESDEIGEIAEIVLRSAIHMLLQRSLCTSYALLLSQNSVDIFIEFPLLTLRKYFILGGDAEVAIYLNSFHLHCQDGRYRDNTRPLSSLIKLCRSNYLTRWSAADKKVLDIDVIEAKINEIVSFTC